MRTGNLLCYRLGDPLPKVVVDAPAGGAATVTVAVSVQVVTRPQETATPAKTAVGAASGSGKRRLRGKKEDPNQGRLFD